MSAYLPQFVNFGLKDSVKIFVKFNANSIFFIAFSYQKKNKKRLKTGDENDYRWQAEDYIVQSTTYMAEETEKIGAA